MEKQPFQDSGNGPKGKQPMTKHLFKGIVSKLLRWSLVCEARPCLLPPACWARWRLHSRLLEPRPQGSLSPQIPVAGLSSRQEQDISISRPALICLLRRLSAGRVLVRGGMPSCTQCPRMQGGSTLLRHAENTRVLAVLAPARSGGPMPGGGSAEDLRLLSHIPHVLGLPKRKLLVPTSRPRAQR